MISPKDSISFRAPFSPSGVQCSFPEASSRLHRVPPSLRMNRYPFLGFFVPFPRLAVVAFINYIAVRSSRAITMTKQCQRGGTIIPRLIKYLMAASDLKEIKPRPYIVGLQFLINIRRSRKYAVYADNAGILSALDSWSKLQMLVDRFKNRRPRHGCRFSGKLISMPVV